MELILLVNDIPDHAANYHATLTRHGFRVHVARSGEEALRVARTALPECAVIDLRLPDMTGWELCRRMKNPGAERRPRLIVLTPEVSRMCATDSSKAGCHAWLTHPTVGDDLAQTVRRVLDLEHDAPVSAEESLLNLTQCPGCESDRVRATLRVGAVQYYCCTTCAFCWRVESLAAVRGAEAEAFDD